MDGTNNLFWELVELEHDKARAFCRKLLGNREDGDDHYQDSLVTALTKFSDLRDKTAFKPWLYRIVVNSFHNRRRKPWWKRLASLTKDHEETMQGEDPTDRYAARRKLEYAFRVISPKDRALITLFEMDRWSIAEIAQLYEQKEGSVKVRLSRIRRKMREALINRQSPVRRESKENSKTSEASICVATKSRAD